MRFVAVAFAAALLLAAPAMAEPTYGLSLLGQPQLPADFDHFPDANPDAPKGGAVSLAAIGSFDSLNPFIVRGSPASGIGRIWDTLMASNPDEAAASYVHLAQSVDVAADHRSVTFVLRPEARFNDGTPVLASDVVWSFNTLREKGRPIYRSYWGDVADVQATGERTVVFHFKTDENRELPMILGEVPIMPEHWWQGRDFSAPLTDMPARQRPLPGGPDGAGPDHRLQTRAPLVGRQSADRARAEQFRHHPLPSISATRPWRWRRSRPARWISARRVRRRTGPPPMTSPPSPTAW